ncbi:MAG: hypothetical protein KAW92_11410 [Candidatus Cloacimonetes bacterium]|nr:hypothetical protein [Candidatus Cloacimonadota bacterium]
MAITLFILGAMIGGLISWGITHKYYAKSSKEQKELLAKFSQELKETNTLKYFELLLEKSKWQKEIIGNDEIWIARENNTFQIHKGDPKGDFRETWTQVYPDKNTKGYPVYLKINNVIVKELTFISLDGGRISVPLPDRKFENQKVNYFWNMNSLEIKVCKIIGRYYIWKNIFGVAKQSKIEILN